MRESGETFLADTVWEQHGFELKTARFGRGLEGYCEEKPVNISRSR